MIRKKLSNKSIYIASALTEALRGGDMEAGRQLYLAVERDYRYVREGLEILEFGASV